MSVMSSLNPVRLTSNTEKKKEETREEGYPRHAPFYLRQILLATKCDARSFSYVSIYIHLYKFIFSLDKN